VSRTLEVTGY